VTGARQANRSALDEPAALEQRNVVRRPDRHDRARPKRREHTARNRAVDIADDRDLAWRCQPEVECAQRPAEGARCTLECGRDEPKDADCPALELVVAPDPAKT
jgi:hypothetical protein